MKGLMKTKSSRFKSFIFVLSVFVCTANSFGQSAATNELEQKSRLATDPDILGQWKMVYQAVEPRIKNESPFFYDDQVWVFFKEGYVKNVAVSETTPSEKSIYLNAMPKNVKFSFIREGLLKVEREPRTDVDHIFVSVITADMDQSIRPGAPRLKKGDLVLSYMGPSKKGPYMQRFLRRTEIKGVQL